MSDAAALLWKDLETRGIAAAQELIDSGREESLHLEFKQNDNPKSNVFSREDQKRVAKAVCGMANAEGGILFVGISTRKVDGLDVADSLSPLTYSTTLRNRMESLLPDLLSPNHPGLAAHHISMATGSAEGIIAILVPPSEQRPHMSVKEQRYFRRGSQGTIVMVHGEIRDLMMATREGALDFSLHAEPGAIIGGRTYEMQIVLSLKNIGRVAVRAPYIRISGASSQSHGETANTFLRKNRSDLDKVYVASADFVLHPDDEVKVARLPSGIKFAESVQPAGHIASVFAGSAPEQFSIAAYTIGNMHQALPEQTFELALSFAAENSVIRKKDLWLGRAEIARLFQPLIV